MTTKTNMKHQGERTEPTSVGGSSILRARIVRLVTVLAKTSLLEILFVASFLLSRYQQNSDFSYPSEIVLPIILFGVLATFVYYVFLCILRRSFAAHIASLPLMYCLYSYEYVYGKVGTFIELLLPSRFETPFTKGLLLALLGAIACGLLAYGVARLSNARQLRGLQLPKVLAFLIVFVFVTQAFKVGIRIVDYYPELTYHRAAPTLARDTAKPVQKPDVYYFVFDRYGNETQLKNQYEFDNSQLLNALVEQGFVTRTNAFANYPFTMSSISSTLSMEYHTDLKQFGNDALQSGFAYRNILKDPPVAEVLKQNGYTYNQVSSWWDFTRVGIRADNNPTISFRLLIANHPFYLSDLSRDIINKSVLSPWLKKGISIGKFTLIKYDLNRNPRQNFEAQVSAVKALASRPDKTTPQFTFAHVLVPHDPYIFAADGSDPNYDGGRNDWGVDEKTKYTNQVTYLNTRIIDMMRYIREQSPAAAIIIQADEGPYPKQFRFELTPEQYYDPADLSVPDMQQKFGVLASYYMPGVDQQKVAQDINSSVNPFRFVLANYLGYKLDMLPECNFATGDKFTVYRYELVTEKLTGAAAAQACQKY